MCVLVSVRYLDGPSGRSLAAVEDFETLCDGTGLVFKIVDYSLKKETDKILDRC